MKYSNLYASGAPRRQLPDLTKEFLVKGAYFTPDEEYPIIPPSYLMTDVPKYAVPFSKVAMKLEQGVEMKDTLVHFYENDKRFLRITRNPERWAKALSYAAGVIAPDFSVHFDWPKHNQVHAMSRSLEMCYFLGSKGIPVIPNARYGLPELMHEWLMAIPEHGPLGLGVAGFSRSNQQKQVWIESVNNLIETKRPSRFFVIGECGRFLKDAFPYQEFIIYPSYTESYWKEAREHAK